MPGPLPDENARRRNAPTLPTDSLPMSGARVEAPAPIEDLDGLESRYFDWAWSTPAAAAWHSSDVEIVAEWARLKAYASRCLRGEVLKKSKDGEFPVELSSAVLTQITNREDRLMLSPMARKKGRAKIVADELTQTVQPSSRKSGDGVVVTPDRWKRTAS